MINELMNDAIKVITDRVSQVDEQIVELNKEKQELFSHIDKIKKSFFCSKSLASNLKEAKDLKPATMTDRIYSILDDKKVYLHIGVIIKEIENQLGEFPAKDFAREKNRINSLLHSNKKFINVGRGEWGLSEWNAQEVKND